MNLTFVKNSTFDLLREQDRADRTLVRLDYEETNVFDSTGHEDFVIYGRNYLERVFQNSVPENCEIIENVSIFEITGEEEPATFFVYALRDLDGVSVQVSDLVFGNCVIESENVLLEKVEYLDKRWMAGYEEYYGANPWYLSDFESFGLDENLTQQIWLTVSVPKGVCEGTYSGKITVGADGADDKEIDLFVEVFDLDLPSPDATQVVYSSPYFRYYSDPPEVALENMAEHDLSPIIEFDPRVIDYEPLTIDFSEEEARFDNFSHAGVLPQDARLYLPSNWQRVWRDIYDDSDYFEHDSQEFDEVYVDVLEEYKGFLASYGVTNPVLSYNDEPGVVLNKRREGQHLMRLTQEAGMETWVTYYSSCEQPLAGFGLSFYNPVGLEVDSSIPEWVTSDGSLIAYWNFDVNFNDHSGNGHHGIRGEIQI